MAIRNVLLFSWGGGSFAEIAPTELGPPPANDVQASIDTYGRRETFLNLNQVKDGVQAFWIAVANLYPLLDGEKTVSVTYQPMPGTTPFVDYNVGDYIGVPDLDGTSAVLLRVVQITGQRDAATGRMRYTPTFESQTESADVRIARWLQRATVGTMGGKSSNAQPSSVSIIKSGTRTASAGPSFNGSSIEVGDESSPWTSDTLVKVTRLEMESTDTGLATSQAELWVGGTYRAQLTLNVGVSYIEACVGGLNIYIPPRTPVVCKCTAIGHPGFTFRAFVVPVNK